MAQRVILGIGDRTVAAALGGQFHELPDVEIVGVEGTSGELIGAVGAVPRVDVVLVHEDIGPLPALDLIRELVVRHPQLAVILVAGEATAEIFAAAMGSGARGVITDDPTLSELQSRVEQAAEWSATMRRHFQGGADVPASGRLGTLLTLCGAKGGTGTTTVAIHLAVALASADRTVCLVDLDLQTGDIPGYLDVQHRHSVADLAAAADGLDSAVVAEALFVHPAGPHLLLSPPHGEDSEEISARAVRQILTALRTRYDIVIVDAGSQATEANAMAVELADTVVVTATPDVPALRGAKRITQLWTRLQIRREQDVQVLLTRHDRRNEIQPDLARKMVGAPLMKATVPANFRALEEAANTGSPALVKNGDFRKAIGKVAAEAGLLDAPAERRGDSGAALVEFAGILPLIGIVVLLIWQTVLVGLTSMYSSHASNEAARAVAVLGYDRPDERAEVRERAVARIAGAWKDERHLRISVVDGYARVTIDSPVVLPGWRTPFGITTSARVVDETGE
ncbi:Septum site-determining protein MinD [Actinomadura rubteroloni]|uniref:Septum site-determining protein MinD n=1 Tax=Actinomadura rubteroloni TaxID=1926885 RepID=A0A2P4UJ28_9ACTN|nr:AAA family ATPase [Actinomadura rubteroloni]POM25063.1 Septum site-determining protein MinD [Actinomadura rubteroloni]